jgi:peroxiredoxin Q/BCP
MSRWAAGHALVAQLAIVALVALAAAPAACTRASEPLLPVGAAAPELEALDVAGAPVKLSGQRGRYAVVFFYPKDDTPGCTREACAFRDNAGSYIKAGVTVFGVSRDSDDSHRAFRDKYRLPFPLVADPSGAAQRAYRVPDAVPGIGIAKRVSFLVGPDGKIARVWPDVDPTVHAAEVLAAVDALKSGQR